MTETSIREIQRPPAELAHRQELERLREWDPGPVPPGWDLSPVAAEKFVVGDDALGIERKFVGPRELVTRTIITLATNRCAMLIGNPGTAKSWLSELLAAAISGSSLLTIQGGAITQVQQLLYSWNQALLLEHGPTRSALISTPLLQGFTQGKIVRFEELARCAPDIQDALLSIVSERQIVIPELRGDDGVIYAQNGFNVIATSNSLDIGVHDMSAALKRRMHFETLQPIRDLCAEIEVIVREATKLLAQSGVEVVLDGEIVTALATIFHELRNGQTLTGRSTDRLASAVMSTAEAVAVAHAMGIHAYFYRDGQVLPEDLVHFLVGTCIKDDCEDRRRVLHYFETEVASKPGALWRDIASHAALLK
jgi:MoxR-like ATPase